MWKFVSLNSRSASMSTLSSAHVLTRSPLLFFFKNYVRRYKEIKEITFDGFGPAGIRIMDKNQGVLLIDSILMVM